MFQRTGRRFARSRIGSSGRVAHRQFFQQRLNFGLTAQAAGNVTSVNMLSTLETYLGYNFVGTVHRIRGYLAWASAGQLVVGAGIGVFGVEMPTAPNMQLATYLRQGNGVYLPWMWHWNASDPSAPVTTVNRAWGYSTPQIDVRVKRSIKTIDQDLQLYVYNQGPGAVDVGGYFLITLSTK